MARQNLKGTSYLGLGLEPEEENKLQRVLIGEDKSAKQLLRTLVREHLKTAKVDESIVLVKKAVKKKK